MTPEDRRKKLWGVRVSDETRSKIEDLRNSPYGTYTEVVAIAIDRLWMSHFSEDAEREKRP